MTLHIWNVFFVHAPGTVLCIIIVVIRLLLSLKLCYLINDARTTLLQVMRYLQWHQKRQFGVNDEILFHINTSFRGESSFKMSKMRIDKRIIGNQEGQV